VSTILYIAEGLEGKKFTITNATGSVVQKGVLPNNGQLLVHTLPNGVYSITAEGQTQRFVKQ
jgi:uncharacterized surface anchored protein